MPSFFALAAPIALLLPFMAQSGQLAAGSALVGSDAGSGDQIAVADTPRTHRSMRKAPLDANRYPTKQTSIAPLDAFRGGQIVRQVRIERRVILRIAPARSNNRNNLVAQLPKNGLNTRYEERKMDKCVAVGSIAGVQTGSGNRLLLFMRDAKIVSVNLEKACRARDFYSGFYVEKSEDGKLCIDRDKLQSRSGAKCEVERMRQLVALKK